MEKGDIVYDSNTDKCFIVIGDLENTYRCLTYDMNVIYVKKDDVKKVGTSYALFKVMYDLAQCM